MGIKFELFDYISNGAMSANILGDWIDTIAFETLLCQAWWTSLATGGILSIEGTNDPSFSEIIQIGSNVSVVAGINGTKFVIGSAPLPKWVRFKFGYHDPTDMGIINVSVIGR